MVFVLLRSIVALAIQDEILLFDRESIHLGQLYQNLADCYRCKKGAKRGALAVNCNQRSFDLLVSGLGFTRAKYNNSETP